MASSNAPTEAHTSSTPLIDAAHPRIAQLAAELTRDADDATDAAVRVHDWVRDRVAFGIAPAFYAMRASEVLAAGVGYCNTKTTLFSALLRAAGIPTRTRMFDLSADVLRGLFDPGSESVDHAVTEVWLDGRWIGVDSYVVDTPLARAATARLVSEGRQAGYGIHLAGTSSWDGRAGARIQCVESGAAATSVRADHGVFGDVADFYGRVPQARNRLGIVSALLIRFGAAGINRSINAVRQAGAG
jgi:transglutaminase-like putative cysteine protease